MFFPQVQMLSPVCSEKGDSSLLDSSQGDISFPPGLFGGSVVGLRDPVDNRVTLVRPTVIVVICKNYFQKLFSVSSIICFGRE